MTVYARSRRQVLKALSAGAALGAIDTMGLIRHAMAMSAPADGVRKCSGAFTVNGRTGALGTVVAPGDTIETDRGSTVVFTVDRDAFLVRGGAHVEIKGRAEKREGPRMPRIGELIVNRGGILSVFERAPRRVVTPTVVAGIRGTGMYVEAEEDATYVCVCYGEVEFRCVAFPEVSETVKTTHHEQPRLFQGAGYMTPLSRAPMFNHTDEELEMLEALVGRKVPPEFEAAERY